MPVIRNRQFWDKPGGLRSSPFALFRVAKGNPAKSEQLKSATNT